MKRMFMIMFICLLMNSYILYCQEVYSVDKWMEYLENMGEDAESTTLIETLFADLSYLAEHPFNLNTVTEEQLKKLPFLSDIQIKELCNHLFKYGQMQTIYELKNVKGLDWQTIELLLPFVYVEQKVRIRHPISGKNLLKYGKSELSFRYDRCLQQKKGYLPVDDSILSVSPNKRYLGEPFYHSLRYNYTFGEKVKAGVVAEKDPGESFFSPSFKGYDYYSAHLFIQDIGLVKHVALGDYKVSFGQGLVISNDFTPGKSTMVTQAERRSNGFRRHFSTNENDYFRGAATTVSLKNMDVSVFYSYRRMDATVDSNAIRSFKTDGLHRLVNDKEKEKQVSMQTMGGNIRYATPSFCLGATTLFYCFGNKEVYPRIQPYNIYYFRGNSNLNVSVDYLWQYKQLKLYGETAFSANGAAATLNALRLSPVSYLSFLLLHRCYSKKYQAFYGNAFGQQSSVQNEQGVYFGMEAMPFASWKATIYADIFRFPWMKYGINMPSSGKEYMAQLDYFYDKNTSAYFRYKYRDKENYKQHRMRMQFSYAIRYDFFMRTSLDAVLYNELSSKEQEKNKGWMLAQHIGWNPDNIPFQANMYVAYFNTDGSQVRLNSYEKNILYAFSMPSFYGKGMRLAASFVIKLTSYLQLSAKVAHVFYADREIIGTALEEIEGKGKTDIYTLLRWKF